MAIQRGEKVNPSKKDADYTVRTYAGYKGEEIPRSVQSGGREWTIDQILSRRRIVDSVSGKKWDEFVCRIDKDTLKIKIFPSGEKTVTSLR